MFHGYGTEMEIRNNHSLLLTETHYIQLSHYAYSAVIMGVKLTTLTLHLKSVIYV